MLASCELARVNPIEYLADILPRLACGVVIARDIPELVPSVWKQLRATSPAPAP